MPSSRRNPGRIRGGGGGNDTVYHRIRTAAHRCGVRQDGQRHLLHKQNRRQEGGKRQIHHRTLHLTSPPSASVRSDRRRRSAWRQRPCPPVRPPGDAPPLLFGFIGGDSVHRQEEKTVKRSPLPRPFFPCSSAPRRYSASVWMVSLYHCNTPPQRRRKRQYSPHFDSGGMSQPEEITKFG